jgi:hypothetical protein
MKVPLKGVPLLLLQRTTTVKPSVFLPSYSCYFQYSKLLHCQQWSCTRPSTVKQITTLDVLTTNVILQVSSAPYRRLHVSMQLTLSNLFPHFLYHFLKIFQWLFLQIKSQLIYYVLKIILIFLKVTIKFSHSPKAPSCALLLALFLLSLRPVIIF